MKVAIKLMQQYPPRLRHVASYLGKLKMQIFYRHSADMEENTHFQSPLTYSSTSSDILVVKIASPTTAAGDSRVHCTRPVAAKLP